LSMSKILAYLYQQHMLIKIFLFLFKTLSPNISPQLRTICEKWVSHSGLDEDGTIFPQTNGIFTRRTNHEATSSTHNPQSIKLRNTEGQQFDPCRSKRQYPVAVGVDVYSIIDRNSTQFRTGYPWYTSTRRFHCTLTAWSRPLWPQGNTMDTVIKYNRTPLIRKLVIRIGLSRRVNIFLL
jgi:hypothetical protein